MQRPPTYLQRQILSYRRHLDLKHEDISIIQRDINKQILGQNLPYFCRLSTTNKCESLHQTVLMYALNKTKLTRTRLVSAWTMQDHSTEICPISIAQDRTIVYERKQ